MPNQTNRNKNHIPSNVPQMLSMSQHGTLLTTNKKKNNQQSTAVTINDKDTEERKQWLECIKLWKQRKDAQCIVIHGLGWHYNIDTDTCVKDS
jgi:hypothetical protein